MRMLRKPSAIVPAEKAPIKPIPVVLKSPPRVKDVDPEMPNFNSFSQEDIDRVSLRKEKLEKLLADEESVPVAEVTEEEINAAIPHSRVVIIDADKDHEDVIASLGKFGGNPRLFTPVPDWLIPYLKGAKVKLEDVEMPTRQEVLDYLAKSQTGKRKRKAGWDIVVDWVPDEQPLTKKSKIEKQLGFDFDSSFGCSLNTTEGRRSRRSNVKQGDTTDVSVTSEDETASQSSKSEISVRKSRRSLHNKVSIKNSPDQNTDDTMEVETSKDTPVMEVDTSQETPSNLLNSGDSQEAEETELVIKSTETVPKESLDKEDSAQVHDEASPGKKRRSRDIIKAYLTSAGVSVQDRDEANAQLLAETNEPNQTQFEPAAALQKIDAEINETDQELEAVLKTLKSRRKRLSSTDNKVSFRSFVELRG